MPTANGSQPRKRPRQSRSRATVNAILDATVRILVTDGYEAMNTNRVAELAGVSIGSLYQYFPNKTALIIAVRLRHSEQMREQLHQCAAKALDLPLREAVAELIHAVVQAHRVDPALHVVLEEEVPRPERFGGRPNLDTELRGLVKNLLTHYHKDIQYRDQDLASLILVRTVDALVHATLLDDAVAMSSEAVERELVTLVLRYLAVEPC